MGSGSDDAGELTPLPVERGSGGTVANPVKEPTGRRLSVRWSLAVGTLLAALAVITVAVITPDDGPGAVPGTSDEQPPPGWRRGAPGPLRHRDSPVQVWTGRELVVWGGDPDGDSGAAYDPAADRWRPVAAAPIPARCAGTGAWSGREVLVWGPACGAPSGEPGSGTAAAAYDPGADRWRVLPVGPVAGVAGAPSVWTGREWVVIGGAAGPSGAFDPELERWRPLRPARAVAPNTTMTAHWTGREVLVFATGLLEQGQAVAGRVYRHWVGALDPASGEWRELPPPPLELAATAVWDGRRLLAWDQNLRSAALDPTAGTQWEPLPGLPVAFSDCHPQGARLGAVVFAEHCGQGALFRPPDGTWETISHPRSLAEQPVWTGRDALFWVGSFAGSADGIWLYRPA